MHKLFSRLIALFLLLQAQAHAFEFRAGKQAFRLDFTESMFLSYHGDTGSADPTEKNYGELLNRLNWQLTWRRLVLGVRLDTAAYVHTPEAGDRTSNPACPDPRAPDYDPTADRCVVQQDDPRLNHRFVQRPIYLEKAFLSYVGRSVEATLGDYYVNIGRGLVLSIRKVDELGIDTTLRGGKLLIHHGDLNFLALVGWSNIQNVDEARAQWTDDPNDFIAAVHAGYRFGGKALVGAHVVGGIPSKNQLLENSSQDYYLRAGMLFDVPKLFDWLALYAEYAHADDRLAEKPSRGDAVYATATAYAGPSVWLFEFKDYSHYKPWRATGDPFGTLLYMQPPTLERVVTQLANNTDVTAGRVRADFRVNNSLLFFASAEYGESYPLPEETHDLVDLYGGAQVRWNDGLSHFFPLVGYRWERNRKTHMLAEELIAVEWDFSQALPKRVSIESAGLVWLRSEPLDEPKDNEWQEGNVYLAVKWAPRLVFAAGYEFNTKQSTNQKHFFNGSITWNITSATSLRLFGGGQRPGIKCIAGLCRDFPAFQGARLELVLRL